MCRRYIKLCKTVMEDFIVNPTLQYINCLLIAHSDFREKCFSFWSIYCWIFVRHICSSGATYVHKFCRFTIKMFPDNLHSSFLLGMSLQSYFFYSVLGHFANEILYSITSRLLPSSKVFLLGRFKPAKFFMIVTFEIAFVYDQTCIVFLTAFLLQYWHGAWRRGERQSVWARGTMFEPCRGCDTADLFHFDAYIKGPPLGP